MSPLDMRGRHASVAPPPSLGWNCPACNAQNTGPLEQGCAVCGSGKPGAHVGAQPLQAAPPPAETPDRDSVGQAFLRWRKEQGLPELSPEVQEYLFRAFQAGYQTGYVHGVSQTAQMTTALSGTAESRTIVAALKLFADQVLPIARDEIESGEYLTIEETKRLIARLERTT